MGEDNGHICVCPSVHSRVCVCVRSCACLCPARACPCVSWGTGGLVLPLL